MNAFETYKGEFKKRQNDKSPKVTFKSYKDIVMLIVANLTGVKLNSSCRKL